MTADPVQKLLDKLCSGDAEAAEQVFREYEPYLRVIVRRQFSPQLRAKFDSVDIVHSIFADVVHRFRGAGERFHDADHLRAFLVKMARNRFIDRFREHRAALDREQPLDVIGPEAVPASREPRPSEFLQAEDLWQQLLQICPPKHHDLLRMKREGRSSREIVEQTGLHEGSIRRILRDLARRLAFRDRSVSCRDTKNEYDP